MNSKCVLLLLGLFATGNSSRNDIIVKFNSNGKKICTINCGKSFKRGCPEIACPRPPLNPLDRNCPVPNCLLSEAIWQLWPVYEDPTSFWQCPHIGIWSPIKKNCGCATLFDYYEQRCVHPHEFTPQCAGHPANPQPRDCPICNNCIDDTPTQLPTLPTAPTREPTTVIPNLCPCYPFTCFCSSNPNFSNITKLM